METKMIGAWQCNYLSAESIIIFNNTDDQLFAYTYYLETNMLPIKQNLILQENKYLVRDSQMGEYFIIDNVGILLIYDKEGLVAKAVNVTPGLNHINMMYPIITFTEFIGQDYRYIVGMTSRVAPKIIYSDSDEMLIYCSDTGMYFEVDKSTKRIRNYAYNYRLHKVKASDLNYFNCAN